VALERQYLLVAVCSWRKADKLDGPPLRPL